MNAPILLNVNGIEVIYHHVILVLKGVSLKVPEGGVVDGRPSPIAPCAP
jgi:branched-chain amino acid transport system ATP-binding protein